VPRSTIRQRSEQNGRKRFAGVESAGFLQIGQRMVSPISVEICQIAAMLATARSIDLTTALVIAAARDETGEAAVVSHQFVVTELPLIRASIVESDADNHL
jgi:hypothetical protein